MCPMSCHPVSHVHPHPTPSQLFPFQEIVFDLKQCLLAYSILQCLEIAENVREILLLLGNDDTFHAWLFLQLYVFSLNFIQYAMSANRKATFISSLAEYLDTAIAFTLCIHSLGIQEMSELLHLNYFMILLVFSVFEVFFFNYF